MKYCNQCHTWKEYASFRYESQPPSRKHLAPRKLLGRTCNACREAALMKNEKRLINAQMVGEINWLKADIRLKEMAAEKAAKRAKVAVKQREGMLAYHQRRREVLAGMRPVWKHTKPDGIARDLLALETHQEELRRLHGYTPGTGELDPVGYQPEALRRIATQIDAKRARLRSLEPIINARSQWAHDPEAEAVRRAKLSASMKDIWARRKAGELPMPTPVDPLQPRWGRKK